MASESLFHLTTVSFKSVVTSDSMSPDAFIPDLTRLIIDTVGCLGAVGFHSTPGPKKQDEIGIYLFDSSLAALIHAFYFHLSSVSSPYSWLSY